ncbi:MAG: hypothetical protein ACK56F_24435 [bacterium]
MFARTDDFGDPSLGTINQEPMRTRARWPGRLRHPRGMSALPRLPLG